ncbi:type IV pilus assembly protein PilM [Ruminiclostridium sufflavum DSM 19573]|uniref:Type IV pilus assembly protein PilM n=1 Tax=Ruminiclostridium sufflavum DSM 19573 TaxID=1121337 RepID=A0A318XKM5_9FIRM|nr:pilus assembly protein PilM [Ruminiclostridium sufflavum]PYG85644.1 type IV pilus assembly protein PilM [Ruminiclostridium sufflavum DSM 19573]
MFEKKLISLDIGNRTTKIAYGSANKKNIIVDEYDIIETPENCINDGIILNAELLSQTLIHAFKNNKLGKAGIVLSVTGTGVITREIQIPLSTDKEIGQILEFEAQQYFPVDLQNYTMDYKLLENVSDGENSQSRVLLVAAPNKQIEGYIHLAKLLKQQLAAVDIPANCVIKGFSYKTDEIFNSEEEFAVVDIGYDTSMVCIFRNNNLKFNRILLSGSSEIDRNIAEEFSLEHNRAEQLKVSYRAVSDVQGEVAAVAGQSDLAAVIERAMSNIASDISRFIDFSNSRDSLNRVQRLYICGGGSKLAGIIDYFAGYFNLPVSLLPSGNELVYKGKKGRGVFEQDYIRLVNVIGGLVRK